MRDTCMSEELHLHSKSRKRFGNPEIICIFVQFLLFLAWHDLSTDLTSHHPTVLLPKSSHLISYPSLTKSLLRLILRAGVESSQQGEPINETEKTPRTSVLLRHNELKCFLESEREMVVMLKASSFPSGSVNLPGSSMSHISLMRLKSTSAKRRRATSCVP